MPDNSTPFSNVCDILSDLWLNYRTDDDFKDFIEYNDIGLPLAYAVANGIAEANDLGSNLIIETWDLLLEALGVDDTGFDNLDDLLDSGGLSIDED